MSKLTSVTNKALHRAATEIIMPVLADSGDRNTVLVVLVRVIITVLLFYADKNPKKAAHMFEHGITPQVIEGLTDFENDERARKP